MSQTIAHFAGRLAEAEGSGPLPFCNPTTRRLPLKGPTSVSSVAPEAVSASGAQHVWRSRDNRKGRHAVTLTPEAAQRFAALHPTNTLRETFRGVGKMFVRFPVWDVSYDVATIFTLG